MKKKDVNWTSKAPQRLCSRCAFMYRYGDYNLKFGCSKHDWATKGNAVCDDFEAKEVANALS